MRNLQISRQIYELGQNSFLSVSFRDVPIFVFRVVFPAGILYEDFHNNGISALCFRLFFEGNTRQNWQRIHKDFEAIGVEYHFLQDGIQFCCLSACQSRFFDLLYSLLCYAGASKKRFLQLKEQMIAESSLQFEDSEILASWILRRQVFLGEAQALLHSGSVESLRTLDFESCSLWQKSFLCNGDLRFYCAGGAEISSMRKSLDKILCGLETSENLHRLKKKEILSQEMQQKGNFFVEREREQSVVALGHRGMVRWSPDWSAMKAVDQIFGLGVGFSARLPRRLREELGLCYFVYGEITSGASFLRGVFQMVIGTSDRTALEAVSEMESCLLGFLRAGPTEVEVEDVRAHLLGGCVFLLETCASLVHCLVEMDRYSLDCDYLIQEQKEFENLNRNRLHELAQRWYQPENLTRVLVGRKKPRNWEVLEWAKR